MADCIRVFFSGTVQGVGFRYQVQIVARQMNLNGWVRNLSDGRVEMLAEGNKAELESLVQRVEDRMDAYISSTMIHWEPEQGGHVGFSIAPTV